jgi:hypothetical protein
MGCGTFHRSAVTLRAGSGRLRHVALAAIPLLILALRPTAAMSACVGDCSEDSEVTVNELITMVTVALGTVAVSACVAGDVDADGTISINEIISGVNNALNGCSGSATPTPTVGGTPSYTGDYYGTASIGSIAVRFHVSADGSANGFLDFLSSGAAAATLGEGGAADVVFSVAVNGQTNLTTGDYQLNGVNAGSPFQISGQLPSGPNVAGTFSVTLFETNYEGALMAGAAPPPSPTRTPTPAPGCDTGNLQMNFSGVSGGFNGIASNFTVELMNTAIEQPAPDYIAGLHEVYNSLFNGTECVQQGQRLRNIQISLFEVPGGLAAGQSFSVGTDAIVYYGEEGSGGDRVWSSSAGTVFIDAVNGSVVTLRVVGVAMTEPAGAAAGSFTLDVSGQVNNFARQ